MYRWINKDYPPSGAIPRFPIWEVIVMAFAVIAGIVGFIRPDSTSRIAVLGDASNYFSLGIGVGGAICIIGLIMSIPNGYVVNLAGAIILTISSGGVVVGMAVFEGDLFFTGSIALYVFMIGSIVRSLQLFIQLKVLHHKLTRIVNREDG